MKSLTRSLIILFLCWTALPAIAQNIYIDPGHFDGDGRCPLEIETNLAVGLKLKELLSMDERWEIEMSRGNGKVIKSLAARAQDANEFNAHLFLSIHCNALGNECHVDLQPNGTETFWCEDKIPGSDDPDGEDSQRFARLVQKHMVDRGKWFSRRVAEDFAYLGHHLAVLRLSHAPACLNEIGFVTNAEDRRKLEDDKWREQFALAYRDAIYEFFQVQLPQLPRSVESISIRLFKGWNVISIPGMPVNSNPNSLVRPGSQIALPLYRYKTVTGFQKVRQLKLGEGYWIYTHSRSEVIHIPYIPADHYTISLEKELNLIGSVSGKAAFDDFEGTARLKRMVIRKDPIDKQFYHVLPGALKPGIGYYVYANRAGTLTVKVSAPAAPASFLTEPRISNIKFPTPPPTPFEAVQASWSRKNFVPNTSKVLANFPNPFNPETWIPFQLKQNGVVTIYIRNSAGHLVKKLEVGSIPAGVYDSKERAVYWDGTNEQGEPVSSGTYFYTLQTRDFQGTKKMLLLK